MLAGTSFLYSPYIENELIPVLNHGKRPPMASGFEAYLSSPGCREISANVTKEALAEANSHPYDTHPALKDRTEALADGPSVELDYEAGPAIDLVQDLEALEAQVLSFMFDDERISEMPSVAWEDVAHSVWLENRRFTGAWSMSCLR